MEMNTLRQSLRAQNIEGTKSQLETAAKQGALWQAVQVILEHEPFDLDMAKMFQLFWSQHGLYPRQRNGISLQTLRELMWHTMPQYVGSSMVLYRGENLGRYERNEIGVSWTTDYDARNEFCTASTMASYHAEESGGVVLKGYFPAKAIISDMTTNSARPDEQEYLADASMADYITVIARA